MMATRNWVVLFSVGVLLATASASIAGPQRQASDPYSPTTKPCGQEQAGYLVVPHSDVPGGRLAVEPYFPMPGDIFLYDDFNRIVALGFKIIGSDAPIHAAIVVARPEGSPAILEVGPESRPHAFTRTFIVEVLPRLTSYPGGVMVRQLR